MKVCQLCNTPSEASVATCPECGEATWFFPELSTLFGDDEDKDKPKKRGRPRKEH